MRLKLSFAPKKHNGAIGLILRSLLAGFLAGAAVSVFNFLAEKVSDAGYGVYSKIADEPLSLLWALPLAAGLGLISLLILKLDPEVAGSGIPNAEKAFSGLKRLGRAKVFCGTVIGGLITFFGGLSLGAEGPSVAIGAAVGYAVADRSNSNDKASSAIAAGAAGAGFAAAFHAPVAGMLFAMEELKKGFDISQALAALSAAAASVAGFTLTGLIWGGEWFKYDFSAIAAPPVENAWWSVFAVALAAGCAAALFIGSLESVQASALLKRIPVGVRLTSAFILAALAAAYIDGSFGSGQQVLNGLIRGECTLKATLMLFAAKTVLTLTGFYSKATGGLLIPSLALGALIGGAVGEVMHVSGAISGDTTIFVVAGMAAFMGAAFGTPLTAAVLALELTCADARASLYILAAVIVASAAASLLKRKPLYEFMIADDFFPGSFSDKLFLENA